MAFFVFVSPSPFWLVFQGKRKAENPHFARGTFPILSRDPSIETSRKPGETAIDWFSIRTMVAKNGWKQPIGNNGWKPMVEHIVWIFFGNPYLLNTIFGNFFGSPYSFGHPYVFFGGGLSIRSSSRLGWRRSRTALSPSGSAWSSSETHAIG